MTTRQQWYLAGGVMAVLFLSFVVGMWLVFPGGGSRWMEALPVVGEQLRERRLARVPEVDEAVLTTPFVEGGIRKGIEQGAAVNYTIRGRLTRDVVVREGDGMLQGEIVLDGYLQSQPVTFLAGSVDGQVFFGDANGGAISYRQARSVDVVGLLKAGRAVEIEVRYDRNNPGNERMIVMLEGLAEAMREGRVYEPLAPMTLYGLKLAVVE